MGVDSVGELLLAGASRKLCWAEANLRRLRSEASELFDDPNDPSSLPGLVESDTSSDAW